MNLTLLPTDLKFTHKGTEKGQSTLNDPIGGNHSSQFEQLLNAETASMQKSVAQEDGNTQVNKNSLQEGQSAADKTVEGGRSLMQTMPEKTAAVEKSPAEILLQETGAEFAVLKEEDLLSADALNAIIPIQIAGLINSQTSSVALPEDAEGENSAASALLGKNIKANARFVSTDSTQQPKEDEPDDGLQSLTARDATFNNKAENTANTRPALEPIAGQVKSSTNNKFSANNFAANNKAEPDSVSPKNTVLNSSKELNLPQSAIQGIPALTATAIEPTSIDSTAISAASPLLSNGQQTTGQFQLNNTAAPLLNAHLGSEEWQQQLNQHVLFFNRNGLQQAELRLHPQELGALHIRMSVEDNQAQLHFVSAHQAVRAALEAALPGLRHTLAESGIQLAQSSVNSEAQGNWQQEHHASNQANNQTNSHSNAHGDNQNQGLAVATGVTASHSSAIKMTPQQLASTRGGVDTFA
ncbi:flagellar hook-length control protein FliK [Xenorhabdus hominickii]|uniref:Flagellar hook-length control protein FliK n=1 Tax=Xenorhabdus hominickii TaxID=351679 RepID=A0A2G0Q648_XENHO|nr:flagellar hook-length control protein FliK [Xenorhabdus hominickii]AOM39527.1 flagellar hook-length control protein FliK [Xenorhabdus hominickii]PHM54700.1 flagellar hook-length control protein FliK [Xenorhabdus hominickii]